MTETAARSEAARLKTIAERWGVRTSIELRSGRGTDPWVVPRKYHRMWHHTATYYRVGGNLTPALYICKYGRSDVPGPLCNGYIGYDRVFRIICMGEANHPGLGGPITIDGVYIPQNSARKPTFGIEVEGGYQTWESIDNLGPDMLEVMGRVDCALAEWSGRPLTSQMEHSSWTDRKIDRKDFDAARRRGIALSRKWYDIVKKPAPIPPPTTKKKDKMLYLVKCDDRVHWFITDWITARHVYHRDEEAMVRWYTTAAGQPLSTAANAQPHVIKDLEQKRYIDRMAKDADVDPDYPYEPHP